MHKMVEMQFKVALIDALNCFFYFIEEKPRHTKVVKDILEKNNITKEMEVEK